MTNLVERLSQYPLTEVIPYFQGYLERAPVEKLEAVIIFGSVLNKNNPSDIDYLVVSDDILLNCDWWTVVWRKEPRLEYNGKLPTSLQTENMVNPWGEPAPKTAKDLVESLKKDKACIILTRPLMEDKYRTSFPSGYLISK